MRASRLRIKELQNKAQISPMNNVTLTYCGRIISIAQHITAIDDHKEPIVTNEIAILPYQGNDQKIVHYTECPISLSNALQEIKKMIETDVVNEQKCIADGMLTEEDDTEE